MVRGRHCLPMVLRAGGWWGRAMTSGQCEPFVSPIGLVASFDGGQLSERARLREYVGLVLARGGWARRRVFS